MNDMEVSRLIDKLIVAFPEKRYTEMTDDQKITLVELWSVALSNYSAEYIAMGLRRILQSSTFFPKPAELIDAAKSAYSDTLDICGYEPLYLRDSDGFAIRGKDGKLLLNTVQNRKMLSEGISH